MSGQELPFYATECATGRLLGALLDGARLDTIGLRLVLLELLDALSALHTPTQSSRALVHADIGESTIHTSLAPFSLQLIDFPHLHAYDRA